MWKHARNYAWTKLECVTETVWMGIMMHAWNFRCRKAEVEGLQILGQTELHSETRDSRKKKRNKGKRRLNEDKHISEAVALKFTFI